MSGQRLVSIDSNPLHTEFKDGSQIVYITRSTAPKGLFLTEIIGVSSCEEEVIALFDYTPTHGKPSLIFCDREPMSASDLLRSAGPRSRTRIFRIHDGREYQWEICSRYLRLRSTEKDSTEDLALYHYEVKHGKSKHPPYLEMFYGLQPMRDLIVVTCILMEAHRICTKAKTNYVERMFAPDRAIGIVSGEVF